MILVTKPFLPDRAKYQAYIDAIWERQWLTNNGPLVNELELRLKEYLPTKHMLFLANGTIALQIAIKALDLKGEIITTPFSFVATTSSIVWEGCTPVFVDIDPNTLNIDPTKIEAAITSKTSAIIATHVYGNPCDIEAIDTTAKKYNLKVIYDAAHAFGTLYKGKSIFAYGDISTASFHATKLFHTVEGGAVFTSAPDLLKRMAYMRNFGYDGPEKLSVVGINGKNSEFHAAMGLCVLSEVNEILKRREEQCEYYDSILENLNVKRPVIHSDTEYNHAYYPVIFQSEEKALAAKHQLESKKIYTRRYFYPSLSDLDYVKKFETPLADSVAKSVLCLPLYHTLSREEQDMIARILLRTQNYTG